MNITFDESSINFLDDRKHKGLIPFDKYVHIHFDEKWIYDDYIKKYTNIEPSELEFLEFLKKIIKRIIRLLSLLEKIFQNTKLHKK